MPILPPKPNSLAELFPSSKPILGVVHLRPLPGAPRYRGEDMEEIYESGCEDARRLTRGGVDGIVVENASDLPFARPEDIGPETVASLTAACMRIRDVSPLPMGITCVANAVVPALAIAKAVGARWIRANQWVNAYVANEGLLNGPAGRALRYRASIGANEVFVFADVHVKFGAHAITADRSIEEQTLDIEFFDGDAVIVTGQRTGSNTDPDEVRQVKAATNLPVLVGSGLDLEHVGDLLRVADGAIVGSSLKVDSKWWLPVDEARVSAFMSGVQEVRRQLTPQVVPSATAR